MLKHIIPLFLFFILTPGILWTYSKKHNKYSIALLHACVFAFVFYFINSSTPVREGLAKNDKRLQFVLSNDVKEDKAVEKQIKKVYGKQIKVTYNEEPSEKQKQKAKEKGRDLTRQYYIL